MQIAVIGLGSMGRRRIRLLQKQYKDSLIIGIDKSTERCHHCFDEFGIQTFLKLEQINEKTKIEAVFVCTSPLAHAHIISYCLEAGIHVFTELNLVADRYEENIELARHKNKILFMSSTALYRKEMCYMTEQIRDMNASVIYNYHVGQYLPDWHPWENYQDFFVGQKRTNGCRELLAIELPWMLRAFGEVEDVRVIRRKTTDLHLNYEDTYLIQLIHAKGNVGNLIVDVVSREAVRRLEVFSENLYLRWDGTPDSLKKKNIESKELETICLYDEVEHEAGYSSTIIENQYMDEIIDFMECIQTGRKPAYGFAEDFKTLKLIDRIEEANEEIKADMR